MERKLIFLDSFALLRIAEDPRLAALATKYIASNQYVLVIGVMNLVEIYKWKAYWSKVSDFVASVAFCVAQNPEKLAAAEVQNYPNPIALPVGFCSLDFSYSKGELIEAIEINLAGKITAFERDYRNQYKSILQEILSKRSNFLPERDGKYSQSQQWLFLRVSVFSALYPEHKKFLEGEVSNSREVKIECFKSVLIQVVAIFLEYYVQKKQGKPSDIGDFFQLSILPYVDLAVVDNERKDLIRRINRQQLLPTDLSAVSLADFKKMISK